MTKLVNRIVEKALPEWEAEVVLPEMRDIGQNGARTMAAEQKGTKQVRQRQLLVLYPAETSSWEKGKAEIAFSQRIDHA